MSSESRPLSPHEIEKIIKRTILQESRAIHDLGLQLDEAAVHTAVKLLVESERMVFAVGAGTSSSIARRFAHVLTCSGRAAVFLDPGQAQHGYSGILSSKDVVVAFSRGGETQELNFLLRIAKSRGAPSIGILEDTSSSMAGLCEVVLPARVSRANDACDVIPLASTLAHAAVGDILVASVLEVCGFEYNEFGVLHPGGAVGERLHVSSDAVQSQAGADVPAVTDALGTDCTRIRELRGFVLDMDGVLWHGDQPLPGLDGFFQVLDERGIKFVLATNNPSKRPEEFASKARGMGIDVQPEDVVTSIMATAAYLSKRFPRKSRIHAIGESALKASIEEAGYVLADEDVVAVVVALERGLSYETFKRATLLIRGGAEFIGTNADPSYPTEEGIVPGSGMMVICLRATSDREPVVMGKPERGVFEMALEKLGLPIEQVASVGDRLDTDIAGGHRFGLKTILTLSGVSQIEDIQNNVIRPDWVFEGLPDLTRALKGE
jgi:4-nitrophenyl phosphatase